MVERQDIIRAIEEFNSKGRDAFLEEYGFRRSKSHFLIYEDRSYDSKAIVGVAHKFVNGAEGALAPNDLHGGDPVTRLLAGLGFEVRVDREGSTEIAAETADDEPFDPSNIEDARKRVLRSIVQRRGQQEFRDVLIKAYDGRCAISGCKILDVLEAAHISPYLGEETNHVTNGLLLRADIHTLFDCGLIAVNPESHAVETASLLSESEYAKFHGRKLRRPQSDLQSPSQMALNGQWESFRNRR